MKTSSLQEEYLSSLNPKERQAYEIAKKNLGSLLTLEKTNHYIKWNEKRTRLSFGKPCETLP
jgi:type IV secretory pathway TrbF-like protein